MHIDILTTEHFFKEEADLINRLFEEGLKSLHVRKPGTDIGLVRRFIRHIDRQFHRYIVVHQHVVLQQEFELAGVHVSPDQFKQLDDRYGLLSTSVHDTQSFSLLDRPKSKIFISPLYNSISKVGYRANAKLSTAAALSRKGKMIALGGITVEKLPEVNRQGFDGAALLGFIWNTGYPLEQFVKIKSFISN